MLTVERSGRVLVATMRRAPVNALNDELIAALDAALEQACAEDGVTLLHLRSDERAFCAGADLALMHDGMRSAAGVQTMTEVVQRMQRLFDRLESAPVVTLAEIGAAALGGGLELALACDWRVAACEARLGLPEAGLGLVPGAGGTQRLTRLCGAGVAKRLILGAETIDGTQAERQGLVQWARPGAELAAFTRELARDCAARPKAALAAAKRCIATAGHAQKDGYALELAETRALYEDGETRQLVSAFLARRQR